MRLYEFQAKRILSEYGIQIPGHFLIESLEDIKNVTLPTILKAQVLTGGRGKAGAILTVKNQSELITGVTGLMGSKVNDQVVSALVAEVPIAAENEIYLACLIDKDSNRPLLMASASGGIDIEKVARNTPERIHRSYLDPLVGVQDHQVRAIVKAVQIEDFNLFADLVKRMCTVFDSMDATLVEINPLAKTADGFVALDAKIVLDEKARFRHKDRYDRLDNEQDALNKQPQTEAMLLAKRSGIHYVPLEGGIGMIADGAGTGMLTLDMIYDAGGKPANFCEMGGRSDAEIMQRAMEVVLSNNNVHVLLISLIGGLTRMDEMAEGIIRYFEQRDRTVPTFIRMCGTKADVGISMLRNAGLIVDEDLASIVEIAVTNPATTI
jgi:succinyl-CoA synthetase beta subunit